jgi:hypothetical protein
VWAALASLVLRPSVAGAQEATDEERAGHSRGGYAWGEEHHEDTGSGPSAPAVHRYGRGFLSLGAGGSVRMLQYLPLVQDWTAPPYLQLRGGYFFDGEGMFQHGVVLGIATSMQGDGTYCPTCTDPNALGIDPFTQWVLAPAYMLRIIPEGDLGDFFQVTGRFGVPVALGYQTTWGLELGLGSMLKPWDGLGFYGEIALSTYFGHDATDGDTVHPLLSFEIGIMLDLPEVLP